MERTEVRLFILGLLNPNDLRLKLNDLAQANDLDELKIMEVFENEVNKINKLFCYPSY